MLNCNEYRERDPDSALITKSVIRVSWSYFFCFTLSTIDDIDSCVSFGELIDSVSATAAKDTTIPIAAKPRKIVFDFIIDFPHPFKKVAT